jgi:hypothetical protein
MIADKVSLVPKLRRIYHGLNNIASTRLPFNINEAHDEVRVIQHFSGACRAAKSEAANGLKAAELLNAIDDIDEDKFRVPFYHMAAARLLVMIAIPVLLVAAKLRDLFVSVIVPPVWSFFAIGNFFFYNTSSIGFISVYGFVFLFLTYQFGVFDYFIRSANERWAAYLGHEEKTYLFYWQRSRTSVKVVKARLRRKAFIKKLTDQLFPFLKKEKISSEYEETDDEDDLTPTDQQVRSKPHKSKYDLTGTELPSRYKNVTEVINNMRFKELWL